MYSQQLCNGVKLEYLFIADNPGIFHFKVYYEKGKILCKSGRPQDAAVALMISAVTGRDYTNSKEHFKTNGNAKLINNVNAKDDSKVIELLNKVSSCQNTELLTTNRPM